MMPGWQQKNLRPDRYTEEEEQMPGPFPVVTICGSMRYYDKMLVLAENLTSQKFIVLMPFVKKGADRPGGNSPEFIKMLDDMHRVKIEMASAIYVVGSHIGESTTSEIAFATRIGVPVNYVHEEAI